MSADQEILYIDNQEDAVLFTVAAGSLMSAEEPIHSNNTAAKVAQDICKASRIATAAALNPPGGGTR